MNSLADERTGRSPEHSPGFTLIELMAVVVVVLVMAALWLPVMAGAKADNWRAQCQSNLKQLGTGFSLFEQDHDGRLPPAALNTGDVSPSSQFAWDTYLYRYLGGTAPTDDWLTYGVWPIQFGVKTLYCPTDAPGRLPKVDWMGGRMPWNALRSYGMIGLYQSPVWSLQVANSSGNYPFPVVPRSQRMGCGIWWTDSPRADWNAPGYPVAAIEDPSGAFLLAEQPNTLGAAGNCWPSFCLGVAGSGPWSIGYQLPTDWNPAVASDPGGTFVSQAPFTYEAHGHRFNYLFYDGHAQTLRVEQTVGSGSTNDVRGMWTIWCDD